MKRIMHYAVCVVYTLSNIHTIASDQPKRGTLAYYKQRSTQGISAASLLAVAKQTAKDMLKGAAYGATVGAVCTAPDLLLAYAEDPAKWANIERLHLSYVLGSDIDPVLIERHCMAAGNARRKNSIQYWKNYTYKNCLIGTLTGAGFGALYSLYKQNKQRRTFSPAWAAHIASLDEKEFTPDPIVIGQHNYLVSSVFSDISHILANTYQFYLMPQADDLIPVFKVLVETSKTDEDIKNNIASIVLRLDPRTSYSYYSGKVLPRIITVLKRNTTPESARAILQKIYTATAQFIGSNIQPRYSYKVSPLLYVAFGNGDYKEIPTNQQQFVRKGSWFWRSAEDMAFPPEHMIKPNETSAEIPDILYQFGSSPASTTEE